MLKTFFSFLLTLIVVHAFSQEKSLADYEVALNQLSIDLISEANDESKLKVNEEFKSLLNEALSKKGSFDFPFKNIRAISILKSNDKVKIYNWTLPFNDETYQYFAIVQLKLANEQYKLIELIDKSSEITKPETQTLTDKTWFGALYYEIIYDKKLGSDTYTLLGWDGDYNLTNKKIIEVMTISKSGAIKFGSALFKVDKKPQKRVIFTYSETAVMSLKYHPKENMIIFDYLVPPNSNLNGVFEYYGPSLDSFDAFILEKNHWKFQKNIDVKLDKNSKDRRWTDPNGK
ncbi:MAG: hypothetical protein HYU68_01165 [Bacteroidetes bacterium]|nr:hypothetical protein [Bacteroidota bacterium]